MALPGIRGAGLTTSTTHTPYNPAMEAYNASTIGKMTGPKWGIGSSSSPTRPASAVGGSLPAYNSNPAPQGGAGAYGSVPGPVAVPPSIWQQMSAINPAQQQQATGISGNISNQIAGQLSPNTINAIRDNAATFGVTSGMPGSQFAGFRGLRNLGLSVENQMQQGQNNYLSFLTGVGGTQTNPNLAYQVSDRNAAMASMPDPRARAAEEERIWQEHFRQTQRGGGGGGGALPWSGPRTLVPGPMPYSPPNPAGGTAPHFRDYGSTPIVGALGPFDDAPSQSSEYQVPLLDYYGNTYGGGGGDDYSSPDYFGDAADYYGY